MDKHDITAAVIEALNEHRSIDAQTHHEHHAFIEMMMGRESRRVARSEKFKTSFIGAIAVSMVGALGWLGTLLLESVRHGK